VWAQNNVDPGRRTFEIVAGPISDDLYLKGERLANIISHPPGVSRCADESHCGPEGLIATARASANPVEGLLAIGRGEVASAISPVDVAAALRALDGKGKQKKRRLRAIALLNFEAVYLIVSAKVPARNLSSLKGRWVGIGTKGGRTRIVANAILAAANLKASQIKSAEIEVADSVRQMRANRLDAFFVVGPTFPPIVRSLLKDNVARIVSLDKSTISSLKASKMGYEELTAQSISPKLMSVATVATVAIPVVWLADEKTTDDVIYRIVRAAFNTKNRADLDQGPTDPASVKLQPIPEAFAIPVHPGAARYFTETHRALN
jgi:TRAP transporter TAXI family solute receptor